MAFPRRFADDFEYAVRAGLALPRLRPRVADGISALLVEPRFASKGRLLLTGSGDSLFAARSALPALRRWSGRLVEVLTSLEFARYEIPLLHSDDVVVAISNSGSSSRTRETMLLARQRGNFTVAVTGSVTGPLASLVDVVLHRPVQPLDSVDAAYGRVYLNMVEYLAALFTLYGLGLEIGTRAGPPVAPDRAAWLDEIEAAIAGIGEVARAVEPAVERLAADLRGLDTIWVIGGGPSRGTADYAAAKFHEQLPLNGVSQDLEEWAHLQYFLTLRWKARSVVVVLAPPGNALDRAEELVEGIGDAGGRAIVVAHPAHGRFGKAHARLDIPGDVHELVTPLTYHVPAQLLVLHLARLAGLPLIPLRRDDDYRLIRKGSVRAAPEGLY